MQWVCCAGVCNENMLSTPIFQASTLLQHSTSRHLVSTLFRFLLMSHNYHLGGSHFSSYCFCYCCRCYSYTAAEISLSFCHILWSYLLSFCLIHPLQLMRLLLKTYSRNRNKWISNHSQCKYLSIHLTMLWLTRLNAFIC